MQSAIGVDIGGTSVKMALIKNSTDITQRTSFPFDKDPKVTATNIVKNVRRFRQFAANAPVGVSCAGSVKDGIIIASNLKWMGIDLGSMLREQLGQRICIENDGFCAFTAEKQFGALTGAEHAIYLTIGTGVGGCILANGQLVRGKNGFGGELGHMVTHAGGIRCACGNYGCYETYASAKALSRICGGLPVKEVIARVERGELEYEWQRYLDEVCAGLLGIMAVFSPEVIALGGGVSNAGDVFINGIQQALDRAPVYKRFYSDIPVRLGRFMNDAGAIGAAYLAVRNGGR